jgi:hypothetical protein
VTLLVALHDVAPPHLAACQRQRDDLDRWGVDRATLLVVPDFHGDHPLGRSPETVRWLRARIAAGDEVALHGFFHRQRGPIAGRLDRLRAAWLTAGEGECLAQAGEERGRRLIEGRRLLEDLLGVAVTGYVAPAWLEPAGFEAELGRARFHWHETSLWVASRDGGGDVAAGWRRRRGPVIGFATRTRARLLASLAWAHLLAPALETAARVGGSPARVALHPADLGSQAVQHQLQAVLRRLRRRLRPTTYTGALLSLTPDAAPAAVS